VAAAALCDGLDVARKRVCQLESHLVFADDDDDDESLLDSEVSDLLRSQSTGVDPSSSPCKRPRQPAAAATLSPCRPARAVTGTVAPQPRPSLDLYKMQVSVLNHSSFSVKSK